MKHFLLFTLTSLLLLACTKDPDGNIPDPGNDNAIGSTGVKVEEGIVRIKLKEQAVERMAIQTRNGIAGTGIASLDEVAEQLNAYKIEPTFKVGGKYEQRHRKAGLHLWYDVYFDPSIPVTRAANDFASIDIVEIAEQSLVPQLITPVIEPLPDEEVYGIIYSRSHPSGFNDPNLSRQWHYYNTTAGARSRAGSDINLVKAWEITTGHPEVIVCIVDGGIDYSHPDLEANMWINEAEINGTTGEDDDDNGYVDDIYGWNFVSDTHQIKGHDHGTHVAGTVAAVNNNGIGVAGVAGGNGTAGSGVRLMSVQIFEGGSGSTTTASSANLKRAIVYGADNGAVISQNSWSWNKMELPVSDQEAIDYFIRYAGTDETGEIQTGPMKGGVVIFAAGNNSTELPMMPGAYEPVISVAALGANFRKASYSNYGEWVDLSAPGGDGHRITSTLANGKYGLNAGTSMACPHVSGIAALVVSHYGVSKPGFTNDDLKEILLSSVRDIDRFNPYYAGQLGRGYIDAYMALGGTETLLPPDPTENVAASGNFSTMVVSWTLAAHPTEGTAHSYEVYVSDKSLKGQDPLNFNDILMSQIVPVDGQEAGEDISVTFSGLIGDREYHLAIIGYSSRYVSSEPYYTTCWTFRDTPPYLIERIPDMVIVGMEGSLTLDFDEYFADEETESLVYEISMSPRGAFQLIQEGSIATFTPITGESSKITVSAKDVHDQKCEDTFILEVNPDAGVDPGNNEILLYPNPVTDLLNIKLEGGYSGNVHVRIYNSAGSNVHSSNLTSVSGEAMQIDMSRLSGGVYTVEINYSGIRHKGTIVKK